LLFRSPRPLAPAAAAEAIKAIKASIITPSIVDRMPPLRGLLPSAEGMFENSTFMFSAHFSIVHSSYF
jgi:hypothetical protein